MYENFNGNIMILNCILLVLILYQTKKKNEFGKKSCFCNFVFNSVQRTFLTCLHDNCINTIISRILEMV